MEKYTGHYGYLKGIDITVGKKYLFNGKVVILKEIEKKIDLLEFEDIVYTFVYDNSILGFFITEEELMKANFKKYEEKNDITDSFLYAMTQSQFEKYILGKRNEGKNLPRKVIFNKNKKATTLLYGDEATVVKACKGDKYDKEKGFLMAFFQKQTGLSKTQAKKYLKKITEEKE
ncbi:MAG: hypothetical protein WCY37_06375 [Candidatus Dojkabacteria bacterium]